MCALYTKVGNEAQLVELTPGFKDGIWVEIGLVGSESSGWLCLPGYHSPNSSNEANRTLRDLIVQAADMTHSHLLIV